MGQFTAHNVRLDDGSVTGPAANPVMNEDQIFLASKRLLNLIFAGNLNGVSILDIGCLEGGYTTEFARLGMKAQGIEIRESNIRNCNFIKEGTNLPNLSFVKDDAMNIGNYQQTDCLFVCGLLYHLNNPRRFLESAANITKKVMILETHVAPRVSGGAVTHFGLSDLTTNEGLVGRWFREHGNLETAELEKLKWASWENQRSFWLEKYELMSLLQSLKFDIIIEQFDANGSIAQEYSSGRRGMTSRVMIAAIKQ